MKFYKYLYIGDTIKEPAKIKHKLKRRTEIFAYVICIAPGNDQLEIYKSYYLRQSYYKYHEPIVVGIASSYDEAVEIVTQIAKECIAVTGNCNIKEYLKIKTKGISK